MPRDRYRKKRHTSTYGLPDHVPLMRDFLNLAGYRYLDTLEEDKDHVLLLAEVIEHVGTCQNPKCSAKGPLESHGTFPRTFDDLPHGKRRRIRVKVHRWLCLGCGLTCSDNLPELDPDFMATRRLTENIEEQLDLRKTQSLIAVEMGLNVTTVGRIARRQTTNRKNPRITTAPVEAGFDEKHFQGAILFSATRTAELDPWELLPDTSEETIERFFASITNPLDLLVANLDFTLPIRASVTKAFPNAIIVIDPFHVVDLLTKLFRGIRREEGERIAKRAAEDLTPRLMLIDDEPTKTALEKRVKKRVKKRISRLRRDRGLFNGKRGELGRADQIKVDAWLGALPLLREAYKLLQNIFRLYRHRTKAKTAAALLNRWFDRLSPDLIEFVHKFVDRVRERMEDVTAFWTTGTSNGYTEAMNGVLEAIKRTHGHICFANTRDLFLNSKSPTSVLQRQRAERQEKRAPGEKHASVLPSRKPRGDIEIVPELRKRKRHRRRKTKTNFRPHHDQLGLFPIVCDSCSGTAQGVL
jgi:transposase